MTTMDVSGAPVGSTVSLSAGGSEHSVSKQAPVIVITGTPGTGKSTHAQLVAEQAPIPMRHINVGELVKEKKYYESYDEQWDSYIVDEDKLLDDLEPVVSAGGVILDWHTCDIYPKRWVDLVVVLRCDHTQLWDRLEKRGYALNKIQENNESELMQVVLDDAREAYDEEIVVELQSESIDDLESNVNRIVQWIEVWQANNTDEKNGINLESRSVRNDGELKSSDGTMQSDV